MFIAGIADGSADPYDAVRLAKQIRAVLDTHGFPKAESILSEWNLSADFMDDEKQILQGAENAAYIGGVLNYLQDAPIDHAQFYRGGAAWMGLFDLKGQYLYAIPAGCKPHTFGMPSELQKMGRPLPGFAKVKFLLP